MLFSLLTRVTNGDALVAARLDSCVATTGRRDTEEQALTVRYLSNYCLMT